MSPSPHKKSIKSPLAWFKFFGFLGLLIAGLSLFYLSEGSIDTLLSDSHANDLLYFWLAMSVLPVFGFPIAIFYLYAGAVFGPLLGWFLCFTALSVNMTLSYVCARFILKEPINRLVAKRGISVPSLSEINQFRFTILLRTIPGPPFPIQNYLLALIGIPFWLYLSASLATQGLIAGGMCYVGATATAPEHRIYALVVVGILAVLLLGKAFLAAKRKKSKPENV